jgi:hypothetical protein
MRAENLMIGQTYQFIVKSIQSNADNFEKRDGTGKSYCHYFVMKSDDGFECDCQICDSNEMQNYCSIGDIVKIKIKQFSRNRYTLESISIDKSFANPKQSTSANDSNPPAPTTPSLNPQVAGKASSVALNAAISFYSNRALPDIFIDNPSGAITEIADDFYKFLISKEK